MVPLFVSVPFCLILLSGHSIAPTNPITATLWIICGIWALSPLLMGTPKLQKNVIWRKQNGLFQIIKDAGLLQTHMKRFQN